MNAERILKELRQMAGNNEAHLTLTEDTPPEVAQQLLNTHGIGYFIPQPSLRVLQGIGAQPKQPVEVVMRLRQLVSPHWLAQVIQPYMSNVEVRPI